jgi:hypothetical protein
LQRKAQMLEILGRRRGTGVLALLVSAVALLGAAQAAQAGTLTKSGTSYVYTETDGDTGVNTVNLAECPGCGSGGGNLLGISDDTDSINVTAVGCSPTGVQPATTFIICDMGANGVTSVVVTLGGGNDSVNGISSGGVPLIVPLTANGNTGNDTLIGGVGNDSLSGDAGDDTSATTACPATPATTRSRASTARTRCPAVMASATSPTTATAQLRST